MLEVTRDICSHAKANGQRVHLETGQEPADVLLRFIEDTGCDNLFINFDPANMILYGSGEPLPALRNHRQVRSQRSLQGWKVVRQAGRDLGSGSPARSR